MANIAELSGDEREQRAAELKRKMQEAAKRAKSAQSETPAATPPARVAEAPAAEAAPVSVVEAPAAEAPVAEAAAVENEPVVVTEAPAATNGNGTAAAAVPAAGAVIAAPPRSTAAATTDEVDPEAAAKAQMNRREFLTYAWGAALGLLTLQGGVASFLYLYPRFRAGEFGGDFFKTISDFGDPSSEPAGDTTGKFWMVTTAEGTPKAIYMVCTHLGCLYKWVSANNRFECPCHGSKFSHDGFYIEGPAPRSLDYFETTVEDGQVIVHTGRKNIGAPAAESPARAVPA
jgi:cytochrome b6-f complex iron-sulfur subunit